MIDHMKSINLLILFIITQGCGKMTPFGPLKEDKPQNNFRDDVSRQFPLENESLGKGLKIFSIGPYQGAIRFQSQLVAYENIPFSLHLWDSLDHGSILGPYISHAETNFPFKLCTYLWMVMPDGNEHGSSPVITEIRDHIYYIDEVYFIMPGKWQIRIELHKDKNQKCPYGKNDNYTYLKVLHYEI